ncbi:tRNA splicing endonuclease subunit [Meyerozyma guilliermondii]
MDLAHQVKTNLEHYHLWTQVTIREILCNGAQTAVVQGIPPEVTSESIEWIIPVDSKGHLETEQFGSWFSGIETLSHRPKRVIVAIVSDDSSVVYYYVHDGITAPSN